MTSLLIFAALAILTPEDGAIVPTQTDAQKAYLSCTRSERALQMDNPNVRSRLVAAGATQRPLELAWTSDRTNAAFRICITREGGTTDEFSVTNQTRVYLTNLEIGARYDWRVSDAHDAVTGSFTTESAAPRFLLSDGVNNFRDLGGWRAANGCLVKENKIFRSAGLRSSSHAKGNGLFATKFTPGSRRVTDDGIETLKADFKIKTELELRTPQETVGMDASLLGKDVQFVKIPFAAYDLIDSPTRGKKPFAEIFRLFTDEGNYPILMHCSGGRDRTGTLAFLLNGLLGVPEDDLCRDWESTIFADDRSKFTSGLIQRLIDYLQGYPGDTLQARIESFARSCGISGKELDTFRHLMLEKPTP